MFFSMASYDTAMSRIKETDENKITNTEANDYAKKILIDDTESKHEKDTEISHQNTIMHNQDPFPEPMKSPVAQQATPVTDAVHFSNNNAVSPEGYDVADNYYNFQEKTSEMEQIKEQLSMQLPENTNVPEPYVNSKIDNLKEFEKVGL